MSEQAVSPVPQKPKWHAPNPYGHAASIESMGSISAPLLAATSAALLALVISTQDKIRWPGLALLLLAGAALSFVAAIQLTFWARRFVVTPAELNDWWPNRDAYQEGVVQWEQRFHKEHHAVWANRARHAYNAGVLLFLGSLPVMLLPSERLSKISDFWLAAIALVIAGWIGEFAWIVLAYKDYFDPPQAK